MNHLSLFSGIGGIDLAAHWAGFETVAFCEQNKFCQQVLGKHWPGVPIYDDIFTLTGQSLVERGIEPGSINLISGGFPCQPYSHAGKRMGNEDDRALWPEMFRVIREVRPDWVLGENVSGIISMALDGVLSDLESAGYTCQPIVLPASSVGAWHLRNRIFIIANHNSISGGTLWPENPQPQRATKTITSYGEVLVNPTSAGLPDWTGGKMGQPQPLTEFERPSGREIERNFRGMAHGVSRRVDRLRALGNAVVPQQVYPILQVIADYEKGQAA